MLKTYLIRCYCEFEQEGVDRLDALNRAEANLVPHRLADPANRGTVAEAIGILTQLPGYLDPKYPTYITRVQLIDIVDKE